MAGFSLLLAGLVTLWAALRRSPDGKQFSVRLASLAPLLFLGGALLSAGGVQIHHFALHGLRISLPEEAKKIAFVGGAYEAPETPRGKASEEIPFLSLAELAQSGAAGSFLSFDPTKGLSLECQAGDIIAGAAPFRAESLAAGAEFCHVVPLSPGDELRVASSGGTLALPVSLSAGSPPALAGCELSDAGGAGSLRAFSLMDALNQISPEGCRANVSPRADDDLPRWRFQPGSATEGKRLLLPLKSFVFWARGNSEQAYVAVLDPGLAVVRGGAEVAVPATVPVRAAEGGAVGLTASLTEDPASLTLVRRFFGRRDEATPEGCGQSAEDPRCSFFRVDLSPRELRLQGEGGPEEATTLRLLLPEPSVVPVRDDSLRDEDGARRPVLFMSDWAGSLTREEAQTTLLFPHQVGGLGPLRVRFDLTPDGVEVTAPNERGVYGPQALMAVGARNAQLLLGVTRHEAPWFLLWLFAGLLVGRALLLPGAVWGPRPTRAAILVGSFLLALRALFGVKAYLLFPIDRESFELALVGAALVPAVLVSGLALAQALTTPEEKPWYPAALWHAFLSGGIAAAYYSGFAPVSRLVFFVLLVAALGLAGLAPVARRFHPWLSGSLAQAGERLKTWPVLGPLVLITGLLLFRVGLALGGLKEALILGGNRVPLSIVYVPFAYAALSWLSRAEVLQGGRLARHRPLTLLSSMVLFVGVSGLTNDWGLMLLGLPPLLLVLGARRVLLARVLVAALGIAVFVPKLLGEATAPALISAAGDERYSLSNGAYRLLLTLDPDALDSIGSVGSDRVAEHAAIIRRYAQGKSGGNAALVGDGYLADDLRQYGPAVVQTLMTDGVTATYLMPEFGILGVAGTMAALAALLFGLAPVPLGERSSETWRALMATYLSFAGFYMLAAPVSLVFFTGKNFPLLSIISKSDLLEGALFLLFAGFATRPPALPAKPEPGAPATERGAQEG